MTTATAKKHGKARYQKVIRILLDNVQKGNRVRTLTVRDVEKAILDAAIYGWGITRKYRTDVVGTGGTATYCEALLKGNKVYFKLSRHLTRHSTPWGLSVIPLRGDNWAWKQDTINRKVLQHVDVNDYDGYVPISVLEEW